MAPFSVSNYSYGEIKEFSMKEPQRGASYQKGKAIIDEWTERFNQCEGT